MKIIIGLGNPGEKYTYTRHNIAWLALDHCLGEVKWSINKKFSALTYENSGCLFVKPLTFMNNSGETARKIMSYYKLLPTSFGLSRKKSSDLNNDLIVIHDDLDINFGDWKIATDSGSAGHQGVNSLIKHLKTQKFTRLRLGIKNESLRDKIPTDKFVLQNFNSDEKTKLKDLFLNIQTIICPEK